ncbi:hypothetical protein LAY57_24715 [Argonema antarcticum A004/B2]|nr:hypothetical protein [Argonema antarcticum A004/B2]
MVSGQWSVVSCQLSGVRGQGSVASCQLLLDIGKRNGKTEFSEPARLQAV